MCAVADAGVAARASGVDTTKRLDGFGGWACYWGYDPAFAYAPTIDVEVRRYVNLTGTPTTIAGRSAQVVPSTEPGSTLCTVSLVQRRYTQSDGSSRVEVLAVRAYGGRGGSPSSSCTAARAVAEAAAPRLPAAS